MKFSEETVSEIVEKAKEVVAQSAGIPELEDEASDYTCPDCVCESEDWIHELGIDDEGIHIECGKCGRIWTEHTDERVCGNCRYKRVKEDGVTVDRHGATIDWHYVCVYGDSMKCGCRVTENESCLYHKWPHEP